MSCHLVNQINKMKQKKKEDERKKKETEQKKKQSESKVIKGREIVNDVKYDPQRKSWMGPVTGNTDTMEVTKAMNNREEQLQSQNALTLQHNRKTVQRTLTPDLEEDDKPGNDEDFNFQSAKIDRPFSASLQDAKGAKWGAAALPLDRTGVVNFEKPVKRDAEASHFLSPSQQVKRLEEDLAKRDKEISMLRNHLEKAHRENNNLVEKLKGFCGKHYQDMAKENAQLREANTRLSRQNLKFEGEKKRDNNTKLQQIEHEKELEEKHAPEWQRNGGTDGRSPDPDDVVIEFKHDQ